MLVRNLSLQPHFPPLGMDRGKDIPYDRSMSIHEHLSRWRKARSLSLPQLSRQSGVPIETLQDFERGAYDPPLSFMISIADSLDIPPSWLFSDPVAILQLWNDFETDREVFPSADSPDPLLQRILQESRQYPELFTLLANLVHQGDPKLIRAAQVSLQSLFKQARHITVPWGSRPPGHFEPPSD